MKRRKSASEGSLELLAMVMADRLSLECPKGFSNQGLCSRREKSSSLKEMGEQRTEHLWFPFLFLYLCL